MFQIAVKYEKHSNQTIDFTFKKVVNGDDDNSLMIRSGPKKQDIPLAIDERLLLPISVLEISNRIETALYEKGIKNLGELCEYKAEDLLGFRKIGIKSLLIITKALRDLDLSLKQ